MASIADIIRNGKGSAGSNQSWVVHEVERPHKDGGLTIVCVLTHYGTTMMEWRKCWPDDPDYLWIGTGLGSVSDQGGINTACAVLKLPYRMDRNYGGGGPRITRLTAPMWKYGISDFPPPPYPQPEYTSAGVIHG